VYRENEFPNILFAKDGEVYDLDGISAIAIGGAYSVDKEYRLENGWSWWADEQPSDEIKAKVEKALADNRNKIDVVLSHTTPLKYEPTEVFLSGIDQSEVDKSTEIWLDKLEQTIDYKKWYCGHYHTEKSIDKIRFLFESIIEFGR
jgi:3-oxoacid CoA-transferase subunit A